MTDANIPSGFCQCGCGQPTRLAMRNSKSGGTRKFLKGEPMLYVSGHNKARFVEIPYIVDPVTGCWVWQLSVNNAGYGVASRGRSTTAHRWFYEQVKGPIPAGMQIDHLCKNRLCVNPAHLEAVTAKVNNSRSDSASAKCATKTNCPKGHPYTAENTIISKTGARKCRTCDLNRHKASYRAKKGNNQ